ncbi:DUF4177 domain-containing protein [Fructobacillus fructosus]|uniref:DUF4177 domain-containing protein n=1 Tax=Fructobacillus fructosus TaxID=1631 RepID=UPI0040335341
MEYKVVEVLKDDFYSRELQVVRAENEAKSLGKDDWRLISTTFNDQHSIILFFERKVKDEED